MAESRSQKIHPGWWTLLLVIATASVIALTSALFSGSFTTYVPVTLTSERAGLVMEIGSKVKMRGVQVGRVSQISSGRDRVTLKLDIDTDQIQFIPANVRARIRATTLFSAKFVDLIYPADPSPKRLTAGTVLESESVGTEVDTIFQNLVRVLDRIDPAKLSGVLAALAEGLRGHGEEIGAAITDANQVLLAVNPRADTARANLQAVKSASDTYAAAAQNITAMLAATTTTSATVTEKSQALDEALTGVIGLSRSGIALLGPNAHNLVEAVDVLNSTTSLLNKYNPGLTCMLVGAKLTLDSGYLDATGGANGNSLVLDTALLLGADQYRYPQNLPTIGAKGGPGGKPGCGSLPDVAANWPVRQLITNTGWGTGLDIRPNPGIAFPGYANYFPVTRAVPEPPSIRYPGGPAPGPIPYPGAPSYGAPLYSPDGTPLYPGLPAAPPVGPAREPGPPPPGSEPFVVPAPAQLQPTPTPPLPEAATPSP